MRHVLSVILVGSICVPLSAQTRGILDTRQWPAGLASCWQDHPNRQSVFFLEHQPDQEDQPPLEQVPVQHVRPSPPGPTIFASTFMGLVFLIGGLIGWFVLAACVFVLERRRK